jgi:hypothetical protein
MVPSGLRWRKLLKTQKEIVRRYSNDGINKRRTFKLYLKKKMCGHPYTLKEIEIESGMINVISG